jgi:hypothetical protein
MPRIGGYVTDELWEDVQRARPGTGTSAILQEALKRLIKPEARFAQLRPEPDDRMVRIVESLKLRANEDYRDGYHAGIRLLEPRHTEEEIAKMTTASPGMDLEWMRMPVVTWELLSMLADDWDVFPSGSARGRRCGSGICVPAFLRVAQEHPRGNLWILALATGARQGELLGLRWRDVDLERCSIRIECTLQYLDGSWHVLPPKTARSRRPVALAKVACEALGKEKKRQAEARLIAKGWFEEFGDLVFTNDEGNPLTARRLGRELRPELKRAGLPQMRFHDLRHSTASLLAFAGVPARVAMEVLGHSQISTTMDVYTKVYPEVHRHAAEALDSVLGRLSMEVADSARIRRSVPIESDGRFR